LSASAWELQAAVTIAAESATAKMLPLVWMLVRIVRALPADQSIDLQV
jgi:hypothetical protein